MVVGASQRPTLLHFCRGAGEAVLGPAQLPAYAGFRQLPRSSPQFFYHRHLSDSTWVIHQASIHITGDRQPVGSSIRPKRSGGKGRKAVMRSTQYSKEVQEKSFLISASINSALKAGIIHQSFFPVSFLQKSMGLFSHATNYNSIIIVSQVPLNTHHSF